MLNNDRWIELVGGFTLVCPVCKGELEIVRADLLHCPACKLTYPCVDGIWRMLPPSRAAEYEKFIYEYETIRKSEGRGSNSPEYYQSLPYKDLSDRRSAEWAIRGRSFRALMDQVIIRFERRVGRQLKILDLGAGNGWLSNRFAQRGHQVIAMDLLINPFDGLGAYINYQTHFMPIQAEFDHLPLADQQADLVIFNASFHYSTDYNLTLTETLRLLAVGGLVIVLDTPVYHQAASGAQMVIERQAQFEREYGFPSNSIPSENYLTNARIQELGEIHGLHWQTFMPFYGFPWAIRPWLAKLRHHREPARFMILIGSRNR